MVNHRFCAFPNCLSSSKKNPFKIFFTAPLEIEERKRWLEAMRKFTYDEVRDAAHLDICEDHFNLEEDLENFFQFKYYGGKAKLKKGVTPHIFRCMPTHQAALTSLDHFVSLKRRRQHSLEDILIANKLLKESIENEKQEGYPSPPRHVYDQRMEEEAAETLLLLSRDIRFG